MKKKLILGLTIIMFFFKSPVSANYEKTFFDLKIANISGGIINFSDFKNKKGLIVLGVPSNSFNQEKKENSEVKEFCEVNFNITFPLSAITEVKGINAHEVFKWAKTNYGNSAVPKWNFHKILINKEGKVADTFSSFTKPMSKKIINKIESIL